MKVQENSLVLVILEDDSEINRSLPLEGYTQEMALSIRDTLNSILPQQYKIEVETGDEYSTWFLK